LRKVSITLSEGRVGVLRARGDGADEVAPVALFLHLVYILAVTQLTLHLREHRSPRVAVETLVLGDMRAERARLGSAHALEPVREGGWSPRMGG
jgi:hypothetical protein